MNFQILTECFFIFVLIILNGFFASSEIAIISLRKSRIKHLIAKNNKTATTLMELQNNPDILLATIQIGITVISTLASTFAGATVVDFFANALTNIPVDIIQNNNHTISLTMTVITISYLSLILGELIPKSLALQHTEALALITAPIIAFLAKVAKPFVSLLTISKNSLLKIMGQKTTYKAPLVSEEEIKILVKEGGEKGVFDKTEQEIIQNVFTFTDTVSKEIMTPRFKIQAIEATASEKEIIKILSESRVSRLPVYEKDLDDVIGILHNNDVFKCIAENKKINLKNLISEPIFVPESETVSHLLKKLQKNQQHMAIVINEYGGMEGLITIEDIIEELVGEIRDKSDWDELEEVKKINSNTYLVEGSKTIKDLKEDFSLDLPDNPEFETIAGFVLSQIQSVPEKGKKITYNNMVFSVEKVEDNRIAEIKIEISKKII